MPLITQLEPTHWIRYGETRLGRWYYGPVYLAVLDSCERYNSNMVNQQPVEFLHFTYNGKKSVWSPNGGWVIGHDPRLPPIFNSRIQP